MEDFAARVIAAHQAGLADARQQKLMEQQAEEHKLNVQHLKLALDAGKLDQAMHLREMDLKNAELMQGQPGKVVPDTSDVSPALGTPGTPDFMPAVPGGGTVVQPLPPMQIRGIPAIGDNPPVPGVTVQPQTLQEHLQQQALAAHQATKEKIAAEPQFAESPSGIFNKFTGELIPNTAKAEKPEFPEIKNNGATGGIEAINDPVTKKQYTQANIDDGTAPPHITQIWNAVKTQQAAQQKLKADQEAQKEANIAARQEAQFNNALTRNDYDSAKKVVTAADGEYQTALDRRSTMDKNAAAALKGNQQAMLSLVANHIGMTLGGQKGARITQAVWNEAIQSAPWLATKEAKFSKDGYLSGVTLTPEQINQMTELAHEKVDTLLEHKQRVETEYHDALGAGTRKPATPAAPSGWKILSVK